MITIGCELAASVSLSVELWYFLAVVVLCCLFAVVIYWLVRANRNLTKRVELMIEEDKKRGEEQEKLKTSIQGIEADIINLRFSMLQDFRRYAEAIRKTDLEAREYLKSLGNEVMSRMEEREHPKGQSQTEKQPKIDGKKSLKKGLEIQKEFTSEYELTHKNAKHSLKKGEPDIVDVDKNEQVSEVVAVKSFDLEITEKGKTCRNVKGHKFAVSFTATRDAKAEVETAKQNGLLKIRLVVFNLKTKHKIFDDLVPFDKKIVIRENASIN